MRNFAASTIDPPGQFPQSSSDSFQIEYLNHFHSTLEQDDGKEVIKGLTQFPKSLPPRYFYDDKGSLLFEQICQQPEYYPTRTEASILAKSAQEIAALTGVCELVELGSGSSTKTRLLLNAYQSLGHPLRYVPVDVSGGILEDSARQLVQDYPALQVRGLVGTYDQALTALEPTPFPARLVFFLGSSIGNFSPGAYDQFLSNLGAALQSGDYVLLGLDLQKPIDVLEAAYNDRQTITAQFNLNMLNHLNWRFGGNFNTGNFCHWAFYNSESHQIEMHLRSLKKHQVYLSALDLTVPFEVGETIHTEISRKFNLPEIQEDLHQRGLGPIGVWTDPQTWFGLILCQVS